MNPKPEAFLARNPDLEPHIEWLLNVGVNITGLLKDNLDRQRKGGQYLDPAGHNVYQRRTVINVFIHEFVSRYRSGRSTASSNLLQLAIIAALRPHDVLKDVSRICNRRFVEHTQRVTREDLVNFVADRSGDLADKLLTNLNLTNPRTVFNYLCRVASSYYLRRLQSRMRRRNTALTHVERSKKLKKRTVLAFKLSYLPNSLTKKEQEALVREFGWADFKVKKFKIKEVAKRLHFKNPEALYRKLYKVKRWAARAAGHEVDLRDPRVAERVAHWLDTDEISF
ncbi:MAG: hypothetical protein HYV27_17625 [Candidatus Hydrogenedentes bacterium]|nr:hypothetical protein [Candidatus Hydrogenedentota bacterium]